MKRFLCLLLIASTSLSGCSAFVPPTQKIKAACSEPDATLQVNGGETFTGKAELEVRRDKVFGYSCFKSGYYPAHKSVPYSISGTGMADFVGSMIILIPIVGIFTPGAWRLDETDTMINMVRY